MIGIRRKQTSLYDVGALQAIKLTPGTFHAQLAPAAGSLFRDEDFQDLYGKLGRPSLPPAQMALLMILQYQAGVSDEEAVERSCFDARWAVVLGTELGESLCARSTLVEFRARLAIKDRVEMLFDRVLQYAREQGLLKSRSIKLLLDTRPVVGRGAVEDTFNLLARAMDRLIRAMAQRLGSEVAAWAESEQLTAYLRTGEGSFKGNAEIDWSRRSERQKLLSRTATDAVRLLRMCEPMLEQMKKQERAELEEHVDLLRRIVEQNLELREKDAGKVEAAILEGTAPDRTCSATDPEQRHGRKSASKTFNGHKLRVAVDEESGLVLDAQVLAGNAGDAEEALKQVQAIEKNLEEKVEYTVGDCAFGSAATRVEFAADGKTLYARTPDLPERGAYFPKRLFKVIWEDEEAVSVECPEGRMATTCEIGKGGVRIFRFGKACRCCPVRHACLEKVSSPGGRSVRYGPNDFRREKQREFQQSEEGKQIFRSRTKVEHVLAQLARCGAGQARYFGRKKTRFQMLMLGAVVNLRKTWNWKAEQGSTGGPGTIPGPAEAGIGCSGAIRGLIEAFRTAKRAEIASWSRRIAEMWFHVGSEPKPPWWQSGLKKALCRHHF